MPKRNYITVYPTNIQPDSRQASENRNGTRRLAIDISIYIMQLDFCPDSVKENLLYRFEYNSKNTLRAPHRGIVQYS